MSAAGRCPPVRGECAGGRGGRWDGSVERARPARAASAGGRRRDRGRSRFRRRRECSRRRWRSRSWLGRRLVRLLRHEISKYNLVPVDGFVKIDDILQLGDLRGVSASEVEQVAHQNSRLAVKSEKRRDGRDVYLIRALHGHSHGQVDLGAFEELSDLKSVPRRCCRYCCYCCRCCRRP